MMRGVSRPQPAAYASRLFVLVLTTPLLCMCMTGCAADHGRPQTHATSSTTAATGSQPTTSSPTHSVDGYLANDGDSDPDDDGDKSFYLKASADARTDTFVRANDGREAKGANKREIAELVKNYYAAAAAQDGARACAMLYPSLATGLAEGTTTTAQQSATSCAAAVSRLFAQQHYLLKADNVATMVVVDVRVKRDTATAVVGFKTMPIGMIHLRRAAGHWKVNALLDTGMG